MTTKTGPTFARSDAFTGMGYEESKGSRFSCSGWSVPCVSIQLTLSQRVTYYTPRLQRSHIRSSKTHMMYLLLVTSDKYPACGNAWLLRSARRYIYERLLLSRHLLNTPFVPPFVFHDTMRPRTHQTILPIRAHRRLQPHRRALCYASAARLPVQLPNAPSCYQHGGRESEKDPDPVRLPERHQGDRKSVEGRGGAARDQRRPPSAARGHL